MKTRNIIAILAALPIVAGMTGCKSDEELTAKPTKEVLKVESYNVIMASGDESGKTGITANCGWAVDPAFLPVSDTDADRLFAEKLIVQPMSGSENGTLVFISDQNKDVQPREAYVTLISEGGLKNRIKIRQTSGDPNMSISERSLSFSAVSSESQQLVIESNKGWNIQTPSGVNWIHLDKTSGTSGVATVNVSVDPIMSDVGRSTKISVLYGSSSAQVAVSQEGMNSDDIYLYVPIDQTGFEAKGGEQMIRVESNAEWNAYIPSSVDWLHLEPMYDHHGHDNYSSSTGVGNGEVRIFCDQNTSTIARLTAVVFISGTKDPKQCIVLVEQAGVGTPEPQTVVGDLTSLYVGNTGAEFRYSFVSDEEVIDYGLVYSTTNRIPTRQDSEVVTVGRGGYTKNVLATLDHLEPNTTYYVRAYVLSKTGQDNFVYSPNVVTITTSSSATEPGESDNPDPRLAPRQ